MNVMTEKKQTRASVGGEDDELKSKARHLQVDIDLISPDDGYLIDMRVPFSFFFQKVEGVTAVSDVAINVSITKSGGELFAAGRLVGTIHLQCSRCLAEFDQEIEAVVEAPFFPKAGEGEPSPDKVEADVDLDLDLDEGDVNYYTGNTIDLFSVLHDQLFLAIPIKALCSEDCKGLCPQCGADLNSGPCSCKAKSVDPRLAELKKLKDKL